MCLMRARDAAARSRTRALRRLVAVAVAVAVVVRDGVRQRRRRERRRDGGSHDRPENESPSPHELPSPGRGTVTCRWRASPHRRRGRRRRREVTRWRSGVPPLQAARPRSAEEPPALGLHEAHPLVHQLERRLRGAPRLLRADGEQPLQLALVRAQRLEALADRRRAARRPTRRRPPSGRRSPRPSNRCSRASIGSPVATLMISSRFETPGFVVRVVADLALRVGDRAS